MPREIHYNTPEQTREYLRSALAIVNELGPSSDLRVSCFDRAVQLLAAKQIVQDAAPIGVDLRQIRAGG